MANHPGLNTEVIELEWDLSIDLHFRTILLHCFEVRCAKQGAKLRYDPGERPQEIPDRKYNNVFFPIEVLNMSVFA